MSGRTRILLDVPIQPYAALGRAVRRRRRALGLSQMALAERCDLDRTYLSGLERGRRNPTVQTVWVVAEGLGVRPSALVALAESEVSEGGTSDEGDSEE